MSMYHSDVFPKDDKEELRTSEMEGNWYSEGLSMNELTASIYNGLSHIAEDPF